MTVDERDITKMIAEVEATSWRLRETIRVRELAAMHRLGQMRRSLMLEEQKVRKREFGFDRIETAAEMGGKKIAPASFQTRSSTGIYRIRGAHIPLTSLHLK